MGTTIKIGDHPEQKNMCAGCPAFCCKISAELTTYDIVRIIAQVGEGVPDFVEYAPTGKESVGFKANGGRNKFVLKHKEGACIFLNKKGPLRCSIEEWKPGVCLSYPFVIFKDAPRLREDALCPVLNRNRADTGKMSTKVLEDNNWEWDSYCEIIADWNSSVKGDEDPEDFFVFACQEMDRRKPPFGGIYGRLRKLIRKF